MAEENYLVYEQDEVQYLSDEESNYIGKLRIIEKSGNPVIEWSPNSDDSSDSDWAVISSPNSPNVSFSSSKITDSISINNVKKNLFPISVKVEDNILCRVSQENKKLELLEKNEDCLAAFKFLNNNTDFFFNVLRRYVTTREQDKDPSLLMLQNKHQADIDDKLSALNLVSKRNSPKSRPKHYSHGHGHQHWASDAPRKVWGFFHDMKRDPYTTAISTLSKVYDVVLYSDYQEEMPGREESETVGDFLQTISGLDDVEPGFEILTKRENLAERPRVERLWPLSHEEFKSFVETDGRIASLKSLKERIFRGGIHPNVRPELWCYLLGVYDWNWTYSEREEKRRMKEHEYFVMKHQWKTISEAQEKNFSGYRDRKSIIEKDVNRTDRNHPFYEGDPNSNLEMLNDVLMTYIMYNFDLGYVQGMSDLLAPILYVMQNESVAFWCFVGYMDRVYRNFDLDQSGMKQQLSDLSQILRIIDPEFVSFLEAQDSANLYFCFRWILVRFKRELNYTDTLRLWEVLWTEHLCPNFHLCVAAAILDTEREEIVGRKFGFTDVLKHINGLSHCLDLDAILKKAESIYVQLSNSSCVPNTVRSILNIPYSQKPKTSPRVLSPESLKGGLPGRAERVTTPPKMEIIDPTDGASESRGGTDRRSVDEELSFENAISHSFI